MYRLLVVEDESIIRKGIIKHVPWEKLGITDLKEACNADEALFISQRFQPDIIISDIKMPGLSGVDLCQIIKKRLP